MGFYFYISNLQINYSKILSQYLFITFKIGYQFWCNLFLDIYKKIIQMRKLSFLKTPLLKFFKKVKVKIETRNFLSNFFITNRFYLKQIPFNILNKDYEFTANQSEVFLLLFNFTNFYCAHITVSLDQFGRPQQSSPWIQGNSRQLSQETTKSN